MKIVTGRIMREIENRTVKEYKIPALVLMENAGKSLVAFLRRKFPGLKRLKIVIVCGKGNNGGDGLVVSRLLKNAGIRTATFLLAAGKDCSAEAKVNLKLLLKKKVTVNEVKDEKDLLLFSGAIKKADLVIDALLGTGLKGPVKGLKAEAINIINSSKAAVVAVDLPSGVNAGDGKVCGPCVNAGFTAALGVVKLGVLLPPGLNYAGELSVLDIGIPAGAVEAEKIRLNYTALKDVKAFFSDRAKDCNKGTAGKILVAGGSAGMTGAPCLTGLAALRTGSGLVTLACAKSLNDIFEIKMTEVMTKPVAENKDRSLSSKAGGEILGLIERKDVLVLGPGLGNNKDTGVLVKNLIRKCKIPMVLDADGLNLIASAPKILKERNAEMIITPHPGELGRLTGLSIEEIEKARIETARSFAKDYGVITLLKGACTVVAFPDGEVYINSTGNPGMATAGAGDVLSGVIASLIGQKVEPKMAAVCGAFIHGLAGDLAKVKKGEHGLIASDIIEELPAALLRIKKEKS